MTFAFRPGVRENVGLLIGLVGASGSGKTYTAMELAAGICGDKPFAVIDTEARRALHYADRFRFDHGELKPPFRPDRYTEATKAADEAGYGAVIIDSGSHAHDGEGGILEWHDEELDRMAGQDWGKRERCNQAAWIKPKMAHKRMVQRFLQLRCHLIICLRAEEKTKQIKNDQGKMVPTNIGFQPICEKKLPYELTVSLLFHPERPGYPIPLKLQEQHRELFPTDRPVGRRSGELIREWATGGEPIELATVLGLIEKAGSVDALRAVGAELTSKRLPPDDTRTARAAYKARLDQLRPPPPKDEAERPPESVPPTLCANPDCDKVPEDGGFVCEAHK